MNQAITWFNIDLSSDVFCNIHLKASAYEIYPQHVSEITLLRFLPPLPRAHELHDILLIYFVKNVPWIDGHLWDPNSSEAMCLSRHI